jgi:hypothetical protein
MVKALFVTYLIGKRFFYIKKNKKFCLIYFQGLSIGLTAGYAKECAVGPDYWCKSFENAQDCSAINHCIDTVWSKDNKYELVDSSKTCQWCQRILGNIEQSLEDDEIRNKLISECKLLPSEDLSSKVRRKMFIKFLRN